MTDWNDCTKIYDPETSDDGYPVDAEGKVFGAYLKYASKLGKPLSNTVWYDTKADMCFGADQDFFANPGDFSFFHQKKNFLTHEPWGKFHLQKVLGQHLGTNAIANEEIMFQDHPEFKKYADSTILLLGAGPTTTAIDWKNMDLDYDYVWSCNNFYKGDFLNDVRVDLAALGPDVDLGDPTLLAKLNKDETMCVFEGGVSPFRTGEELQAFRGKFPDKTSYFHLRYFSKIGTMPRLLCFASFLRAKKIYFAGIDGYPGKLGDEHEHAFEGKEKSHDGRVFSFDLHRRQYVLLWEYLLGFNGHPEYQNLGEGHPSNLTTDISTKEFPLQVGAKND